jgi:hypothetical protein
VEKTEDFVLFYLHNIFLLKKETVSLLINWQYIGTHQETPLACSTEVLSFLMHLLRNVTFDIQQLHHIYFMKNRVLGI